MHGAPTGAVDAMPSQEVIGSGIIYGTMGVITTLTVTGSPAPTDVTGTYAVVGAINGYPYFQRGTDAMYIFFLAGVTNSYLIAPTLFPGTVYYYKTANPASPLGAYTPNPPETGPATAA